MLSRITINTYCWWGDGICPQRCMNQASGGIQRQRCHLQLKTSRKDACVDWGLKDDQSLSVESGGKGKKDDP